MDTLNPNTVTPNSGIAETPVAPQDSKAHTGPVARLLSRVSKGLGDYAEYQMEACIWRKISI